MMNRILQQDIHMMSLVDGFKIKNGGRGCTDRFRTAIYKFRER